MENATARIVSVRIGFAIDEVDAIVPKLEIAAGTVVTKPQDSEWGRRAVLKDPDGHAVEIVTAAQALRR
ncbi:MAG: VOC family protein [Planctomycetales bacterium]